MINISSAQDYYPFGMQMPGRRYADESRHCLTSQVTTLIPKKVRVYIDLTPFPTVPFPGGPIVVNQYPWGPIVTYPISASFRQQKAHFNHYLPASSHSDAGFVARLWPGGGQYELDLSNEPSGVSLYLPFAPDTSAGANGQVLGFGAGPLPPGVRMEARVRNYADSNSDNYTEAVSWRGVNSGQDIELRFDPISAGVSAGGKLVGEVRFSTPKGMAQFANNWKVYLRNPWIEKTEWVTGTQLVTLCDEKDKYRYGFNGMEKDNELKGVGNSLDFGARIYDPRLGRWLSLDPLAAKYPALSPYNFVANNPIIFVDPDGKRVVAAGKASRELLQLSLSPQESKFLEFDKNGEVNTKRLQAGAGTFKELSGNYKALLHMSNHQKIVEIVIANNASIRNGNGDDKNYQMAKVEDFPIDVNNPKAGTEKAIQGTVGLSLKPLTWKGETPFDKGTRLSPEEANYSSNNNFQVYISENVYNFDKATAVGNVGHELYGHIYFFMLGDQVKGDLMVL